MSDAVREAAAAAWQPTPAKTDAHDDRSGVAPCVPRGRQIRGVVVYLLIAFALCWLACLPLWLGPGLSDPALVALCGGIAMLTPAITAILVVRMVERRPWRRPARLRKSTAVIEPTALASLGLRPERGVGRFVGALLVGMFAPVILLFASQLLAAALGTFDLDLTLRQVVIDRGLPADAPLGEVWLAFGSRLLLGMVLGGTINVILALGEEIGWRGYLMPRLHRLWGLPTAIIAGGVIWGLWHAPLILLGYNYPDAAPWVGQLAMVAACTAVGGFLYLLTVSLGSLWPAALAHGVNNAVSSMIMTSLLVPGMAIDTVNGSALGWPAWIVYGTVVVVGFTLVRLRRGRGMAGEEPVRGPTRSRRPSRP